MSPYGIWSILQPLRPSEAYTKPLLTIDFSEFQSLPGPNCLVYGISAPMLCASSLAGLGCMHFPAQTPPRIIKAASEAGVKSSAR